MGLRFGVQEDILLFKDLMFTVNKGKQVTKND